MKATGEQTGGAVGLIDNTMPGGFASPYHMHRNEDESCRVPELDRLTLVASLSQEVEEGLPKVREF